MVDWKVIFLKYTDIIIDAESIDYLDNRGTPETYGSYWTKEEWEAIQGSFYSEEWTTIQKTFHLEEWQEWQKQKAAQQDAGA